MAEMTCVISQLSLLALRSIQNYAKTVRNSEPVIVGARLYTR
jgi:hypothetical protein